LRPRVRAAIVRAAIKPRVVLASLVFVLAIEWSSFMYRVVVLRVLINNLGDQPVRWSCRVGF
jgi:hypothetical protein